MLDVRWGNGLIAYGALERRARISLFELINRFRMDERSCTRGYEIGGADESLAKVTAVFHAIHPETDPMLDFDERGLLRLAVDAGFFPIKLEYSPEIEPPDARRWETFLHSSFNPKLPTLAEAMEQELTAEERSRLVSTMRRAVEEGRDAWRMGEVHLWAVKP